MSYTVRTKDLQAGMKVVNSIIGKKGDVKVNAGEVLSGEHVRKLQKWKDVDKYNPRGIEVVNSRKSGQLYPDVVDKPERSPLIESKATHDLQRKISVPAITDENGNVLNPSPLEKELAQREENDTKRGRGRPEKV